MEEKKKSNKKYLLITLGVIGTILLVVGITYAYWILTKEQTNENVVNSACLNITFTGENDINLPKAYPMTDEQLDKFLSTNTPYHFTITNECADLANVTINLESLNAGADKQLEDQYINAVLYKENYKANLFRNKKLNEEVLNDENKVIEDSLHAYKLYSFTLKQNEEKEFNLQLYLDQETPMAQENMNASWKGKITLSSEYKEDRFRNSGTLRNISDSDTNGMWGYKNKLTKIVIETKKEDKVAQEGETKYGPFNEGYGGTNSVVSYVICDSEEANCTGYLQSDGGVKLYSGGRYLFKDFSKVTSIEGLENIDTSKVTDMQNMFSGMRSLQELDISNWDTSNVITMASFLSGDSNLKKVNLTNLDISKLQFMSAFFYNCSNIQELDLSSLDTSNVTKMGQMFYGMSGLQSIDLSSLDTSSVTNMSSMFSGMSGLQSIDLSPLDTSSVTSMNSMFSGMSNIKSLDLRPLVTSNVKDMSSMFYEMTNLQSLNLSNLDTSSVENMYNMFNYCNKLQELDLSSFDTSSVINMSGMFYEMSGLQELDLSSFDTRLVKNMSSMFQGMSKLKKLTFGDNFITSSVEYMNNMFRNMRNITSLDLSTFDTTNVKNFNQMFGGDTSLTNITYGPNFVHNEEATTNAMFGGTVEYSSSTDTSSLCPANKLNADVHPSWTDVSFD